MSVLDTIHDQDFKVDTQTLLEKQIGKYEKEKEKFLLNSMKLDNNQLQRLLYTMKYKFEAVYTELSETDIKDIELDDLIDNNGKLKNSLNLAMDITECFELLNLLSEYYKRVKDGEITTFTVAEINDIIDSHVFTYMLDYDNKESSKKPYNQNTMK